MKILSSQAVVPDIQSVKKCAFLKSLSIVLSVMLGIHIRVCGYVMRMSVYDFSVFEYHA